MIKKGNIRITITLNKDDINKLNEIKKEIKCKNNAKAIKHLINNY